MDNMAGDSASESSVIICLKVYSTNGAYKSQNPELNLAVCVIFVSFSTNLMSGSSL